MFAFCAYVVNSNGIAENDFNVTRYTLNKSSLKSDDDFQNETLKRTYLENDSNSRLSNFNEVLRVPKESGNSDNATKTSTTSDTTTTGLKGDTTKKEEDKDKKDDVSM